MSTVPKKDSGVTWLGEIPAHWEVIRNGALFANRSEKGYPHLPLYSVSQKHGVILQQYSNEEIIRSSEDKSNYKRIVKGDIVYNKMRMWQGAVGIAPAEGIVSPAYIVCAPRKEISHDYFYFLFRTPLFISEFGKYSYGIVDDMNSLRFENYKEIYSVLPPLSEQRAIADHLDRETAQIDALITKTAQLNALLREKRVALISHAVTKGLDPAAPVKDSGVEWLGEIPRHWDVKRLKHVTTYTGSGKTPKGGAEVYESSGVLFLRSQNVHFRGLRLSDVAFISLEIDSQMRSTRVKANDVLLNITGASLGRCSVVPHNFPAANVNQHVCIVRPLRHRVDSELLNYSMASDVVQSQIFSTENGSSREGITFQQIRDFWIALPTDLAEQHTIADHLDRETAKIDALITKNNQLIALLREKRTALISAAVTGKIDLRNAATSSPSPLVGEGAGG